MSWKFGSASRSCRTASSSSRITSQFSSMCATQGKRSTGKNVASPTSERRPMNRSTGPSTRSPIAIGERVLGPVERFIGRHSLVGDATFFPVERFPWVAHIEENWEVIREELEAVRQDREALPNFHDISKDQIEITDDDRWKTFFLYGYGFEAKLGVEMCPRTAALMREIPGMTTAMISILSPRKHILDHRGPYKGVLRYHLGLIVPEDATACRIRVGDDVRHWEEG